MSEVPAGFFDFPRSAFPIRVELLDEASREVRWSILVEGAGAVGIPSKDEVNAGMALAVRVTYADGEVVTA